MNGADEKSRVARSVSVRRCAEDTRQDRQPNVTVVPSERISRIEPSSFELGLVVAANLGHHVERASVHLARPSQILYRVDIQQRDKSIETTLRQLVEQKQQLDRRFRGWMLGSRSEEHTSELQSPMY